MITHLHRAITKGSAHLLCSLFAMAGAGCGTDIPAHKKGTVSPAAAHCMPVAAAASAGAQDHIIHRDKQIYLRGFNIAWFDFARDFNDQLDEIALRKVLQDAKNVGANSLRWWLHVDGSSTPEWGMTHNQHLVVGPGKNTIKNLLHALDIAAEYQVYLVPSLWSFDMLNDDDFRRPPNRDNYRLLTEDLVLRSYLDNALTPMVKALNNHPQLLAWELFNEPENMTEPWFVSGENFYGGAAPTLDQLQRVQGLMAAVIHKAALASGQTALVTTGSKSLGKYNSDVAGGKNLYRDDRLIEAAGGNCHAALDFYAPHYYNNEGRHGRWSPFHHPASYWGLNKPIVIGEFHVHRPLNLLNDTIAAEQMCQRLFDNGYAGGWSWQWNEFREEVMACEKALRTKRAPFDNAK